jgi:hypothetical protein
MRTLLTLALFSSVLAISFSQSVQASGFQIATVDLGASRRALQALIHEWQDDETSQARSRKLRCLNAMMSAEGSALIFPSNDLLWQLPNFVVKRETWKNRSAPVSLRERVRVLAQNSSLTQGEREQLQSLDARVLEDRLDEIRWIIDLQGALLQASNRLYRVRWEAHLAHAQRNRTLLTGVQDPVSLCLAAQVRFERNKQLIRGAERMLALFDFLQLEQDREFGDGLSRPPL